MLSFLLWFAKEAQLQSYKRLERRARRRSYVEGLLALGAPMQLSTVVARLTGLGQTLHPINNLEPRPVSVVELSLCGGQDIIQPSEMKPTR